MPRKKSKSRARTRKNRTPKGGEITSSQRKDIMNKFYEFYEKYDSDKLKRPRQYWQDEEFPWKKIANKHIKDGSVIGLFEFLGRNEPIYKVLNDIKVLQSNIDAMRYEKKRIEKNIQEEETHIELLRAIVAEMNKQTTPQIPSIYPALSDDEAIQTTTAHRSPPIITKEFIDGLRNQLATRE